MDTVATKTSVPRRRAFRFRLRTLLIVIGVFCVVFGLWLNWYRWERHIDEVEADATRRIRDAGAETQHDNDWEPMGWHRLMPFYKPQHITAVYSENTADNWLLKRALDENLLNCLSSLIYLRIVALHETRVTAKTVAYLRALPQLQGVNFDKSQLTDDALAPLRGHPTLRWARLSRNALTDNVMETITSWPELMSLDLRNTRVSDRSIDGIASLACLKSVFLAETRVTDEGRRKFENIRPDVKTDWDPISRKRR